MASKVRHNFKESALALLRGDWCNRVARRVSYWMGCNGVDVTMPDTPSQNDPIKVGLNVPTAAHILAGEMLSKNLLGRQAGVPFSLTPVLNTAKTAVASLNVYLPTLYFDFGGTTYTVETGSGTGYVTLLSANTGWYRINGFTTGDVYLVDDSTSTANRMKFATAKPTDDKAYIHIGKVTFANDTAKAEQFEHPMRGAVDFGGGEGGGDSAPDIPVPLEVRAELAKGSDGVPTGISYLKVYAPNASIAFGRTDYALTQGTASGNVRPITGQSGWYRIYGITTGNLYLIDATSWSAYNVPTFKAKFSATIPSDTVNKLCHPVAVISWNDTAKEAVINQTLNAMGAVAGDCNTEHADGAHANQNFYRNAGGNSMSILPTGESLDTATWKRDETGVMKFTQTTQEQSTGHGTSTLMNAAFNGIKLQAVTRVRRSVDMDIFFWRWITFDKNGMLTEISAEQGAYCEVNYDRY